MTALGPVDAWTPWTGRAAMVDGLQVAVFRLAADTFLAIDNLDPFSGANVLSRGIVGAVGGIVYVASPIRKERFDLRTGICLEHPDVSVGTHRIEVANGLVQFASAQRISA